MAVDSSIILGFLSFIYAVSALMETLGRTTVTTNIIISVLTLIISLVPLIIKIFVFSTTKKNRVKEIGRQISRFVLGDYYDRFNFHMWKNGYSIYCNIFCEGQEFFKNKYKALVKPGINLDFLIDFEGSKVYKEIDLCFVDGDSWRSDSDILNSRSSAPLSSIVQKVWLRDGKKDEGVLAGFFPIDYSGKEGVFSKDILFFCDSEGAVVQNCLDISDYHLYSFEKVVDVQIFDYLIIEGSYNRNNNKISVKYKTDSYPDGREEFSHEDETWDFSDFKKLIILLKHFETTGWVKIDSAPKERRGSFVFHSLSILNCLREIKFNGYQLFEININTSGKPCYIEGETSSDSDLVLVEKIVEDKSREEYFVNYRGLNSEYYNSLKSFIYGFNDFGENKESLFCSVLMGRSQSFYKPLLSNWRKKKFLSDINILNSIYSVPKILNCDKFLPSKRLVHFMKTSSFLKNKDLSIFSKEWRTPHSEFKIKKALNSLESVCKLRDFDVKSKENKLILLNVKRGLKRLTNEEKSGKLSSTFIENVIAESNVLGNSSKVKGLKNLKDSTDLMKIPELDNLFTSLKSYKDALTSSLSGNLNEEIELKAESFGETASELISASKTNSKKPILNFLKKKNFENLKSKTLVKTIDSVDLCFKFSSRKVSKIFENNLYYNLLKEEIDFNRENTAVYKKLISLDVSYNLCINDFFEYLKLNKNEIARYRLVQKISDFKLHKKIIDFILGELLCFPTKKYKSKCENVLAKSLNTFETKNPYECLVEEEISKFDSLKKDVLNGIKFGFNSNLIKTKICATGSGANSKKENGFKFRRGKIVHLVLSSLNEIKKDNPKFNSQDFEDWKKNGIEESIFKNSKHIFCRDLNKEIEAVKFKIKGIEENFSKEMEKKMELVMLEKRKAEERRIEAEKNYLIEMEKEREGKERISKMSREERFQLTLQKLQEKDDEMEEMIGRAKSYKSEKIRESIESGEYARLKAEKGGKEKKKKMKLSKLNKEEKRKMKKEKEIDEKSVEKFSEGEQTEGEREEVLSDSMPLDFFS